MEKRVFRQRVFRRSEIEHGARGWVVDLSPGRIINPDYYWRFPTRRAARRFLELVQNGVPAWRAVEQVYYEMEVAR